MDAAEQVRQTYQCQLDAMVAGDVHALDGLLAPDYTARHITGYRQPKREWLQQIRDGEFTYHAIEVESVDVRVDGDTATLVSRAHVDVTIGASRGRWPLESTIAFENRSGSWAAIASAATTF
jgi:ketosteroid isomerase-like protein